MLSHAELQQYGSFAQRVCSQAPQLVASAAPVAHTLWVQEPPPHDSPQTEATSPTQMLSHCRLQQ
jgi:hypothetical protein